MCSHIPTVNRFYNPVYWVKTTGFFKYVIIVAQWPHWRTYKAQVLILLKNINIQEMAQRWQTLWQQFWWRTGILSPAAKVLAWHSRTWTWSMFHVTILMVISTISTRMVMLALIPNPFLDTFVKLGVISHTLFFWWLIQKAWPYYKFLFSSFLVQLLIKFGWSNWP